MEGNVYFEKYYKNEQISEKELQFKSETGDILLFEYIIKFLFIKKI